MHYSLIYISLMVALFGLVIIWTIVCCIKLICNTPSSRRSIPQRSIPHTESRARLIQSTQELPTCVSYFDLPAPPKFEHAEAPPSYEEAVGVHRSARQHQQPIAQPIAAAMAQNTQLCTTTQVNHSRRNKNKDVAARSNDSPARNNDSAARNNDSAVRNNDSATRNNDSITSSNDLAAGSNDLVVRNNDSVARNSPHAFIITVNEIPTASSNQN